MNICIIAPSSLRFVPYLNIYMDILGGEEIVPDVVYWDRFNLDSEMNGFYRYHAVSSSGKLHNICGYIGFRKYLLNHFKKKKYDFYVVLTVQVAVLIADFLRNKRFALDIRDFSYESNVIYSAISNYLFSKSSFISISSDGFRQWLPAKYNYVISHNIASGCTGKPFPISPRVSRSISVAYIGEVRYTEANCQFIRKISSNAEIALNYYGIGPSLSKIQSYVLENNIKNVKFHGLFSPDEKEKIYLSNDFILCFFGSDHINVRTLTPNRLYESAYYGKPLIVSGGTYFSCIVDKYNLGVVLQENSGNMSESKIQEILDNFDIAKYESGRSCFLNEIKSDIQLHRSKYLSVLYS